MIFHVLNKLCWCLMDIELIINMIINYMIQLWFKQATETA